MAWDRRNRSASSSSGGRAGMKELEFSSSSLIQPWACSSLSSSEKFLSRCDKMQEDRGEKKIFNESLCTLSILQEAPTSEDQQHVFALLPSTMMMIGKPDSNILFPPITSRGSLVGNKMSCRTSIRNRITWRQKNCTRRMRSSLMILNFYYDRSSRDSLLALRQTPPPDPADSATVSSQKQLDHSLNEGQCRRLSLSLAGAAGMRLICPPLQLPLLEILLFFRQQLSSKNRAVAVSMGEGGGLWRFPVNLALATLRPFTGSLVRRCLTAMICLAQMRIKKKGAATIERQNLWYLPADLYSVLFEKERYHLEHSKEFTAICSTSPVQIGDPVVKTATEAADDDADGATRPNHNESQLLSNVLVGRSFEEHCCSEEFCRQGVPVAETMISGTREDSLLDNKVLNLLFQQDQYSGSGVGTRSEKFQFSLSDLKELKGDKLVSLKPFAKQTSEDLTTGTVGSFENGFVLSCKRPHIVTLEEPRNELSFAQCGFAVSQTPRQVRLQFPTSSPVVKAAPVERVTKSAPEEESGVVVVEDDSMTSTDGACVVAAEEELEESTFISQATQNLKETIDDELADDDAPCLPCGRERHGTAVKEMQEVESTLVIKVKSAERFVNQELEIPERTSITAPVEKLLVASEVVVENQPTKDIQEVNSIQAVEGNLPEITHDEDSEVCPNEVQSIGYGNCLLSELLQGHIEVFRLERNSAENKLIEKESLAASAEMVPLENLSPTLTGVVKNEAVKEGREKPVETLSLALVEGLPEKDTVKEIQKLESILCVDEKNTADELELPERLHSDVSLSDWAVAVDKPEKGLPVAALMSLPVEVPSLASAEVSENEAFSGILEVNSGNDVAEKSGERVIARVPELKEDSSPQDHSGKRLSEPFTHTSLTRRPNTATEAQNTEAFDPDSGASAVLLDKLNRDQKDGHIVTEGNSVNVIHSDSTRAHNDSQLLSGPTETVIAPSVTIPVVSSSDDNCNSDRSVNGDDHCFPELNPISSPTRDASSTDESCGFPEAYPEHPFADHPMCIELRECRHSHGDQTYIDMQDLLPPPWGQLIFWHGRCKEGRPTLCVLLGKAVRQLPNHELKHFIAVTVSHLEYAEVNFFKGSTKQMNILMDLEGLGFMRLPPMHILSSIGDVLNRDYAGRGGWIMLVNAPVMLGFVISAIQGVIFHNKGDLNQFKGFLEGKERILMMGHKYRPALQKHFDTSMLSAALGGDCHCRSGEESCRVGHEFLKLPWNTSSTV